MGCALATAMTVGWGGRFGGSAGNLLFHWVTGPTQPCFRSQLSKQGRDTFGWCAHRGWQHTCCVYLIMLVSCWCREGRHGVRVKHGIGSKLLGPVGWVVVRQGHPLGPYACEQSGTGVEGGCNGRGERAGRSGPRSLLGGCSCLSTSICHVLVITATWLQVVVCCWLSSLNTLWRSAAAT
jgi:hypothetical protein